MAVGGQMPSGKAGARKVPETGQDKTKLEQQPTALVVRKARDRYA